MPKFAHTMIRVKDLEATKAFYSDVLQMRIFKEKEYPAGRFTLVFFGYTESGPMIELTYNWDERDYTLGDAFGHLAIFVEDIYAFCEEAKAKGAKVVREPGPMKHGGSSIAFIEDPDGYKIEIIKKND